MPKDFPSPDWQAYTLLDSGKGRKLEQFGAYRIVRPEPRAVWKPAWAQEEWEGADAVFVEEEKGGRGEWMLAEMVEKKWQLSYKELRFWIELEQSRQVGVFPENAVHWDWIGEKASQSPHPLNVLNLFGYTGLASLVAAKAGAEVTHIDSSKRAIRLGRENQALSGLEDRPIRWIVEDAVKFVRREIKRGVKYDGIIFDPPKYGMGPKKERWEFFKDYPVLCDLLGQVLSDSLRFVVVTAYALESKPDILLPPLEKMLKKHKGEMEIGELVTTEQSAGRKISYSITARWQAVDSG